jgi:hypothetical protein
MIVCLLLFYLKEAEMSGCQLKKGSADVVKGKLAFRNAQGQTTLELSKEDVKTLYWWLSEHVIPKKSMLWVLCELSKAEEVAQRLATEYHFQNVGLEPSEKDTRWVTIPLNVLYQPGDANYRQKVEAVNAAVDLLPGVRERMMRTETEPIGETMTTY